MKRIIFIIVVLLCGSLLASVASVAGCDHQPIAKVSVLSNGELLLNGHKSNIQAIDHAFKRLAQEGGTVWYYRENGREDPPPIAMNVIKLVVKYQLPITLSGKADFSNYIGPDGRPHPRSAEQCAPADRHPVTRAAGG